MTVLTRILGRSLGLPPVRTPRVRVARDLGIPMADGVRVLADRYHPADDEHVPLVLIRTPYGRASMGLMARLIAERGYQVLVVSLRGTGGSGGRFTGWNLESADGPALIAWLREQDWFHGAFATWGASFLGYAQWELAGAPVPEWKAALVQDAPAEVYATFMYRGGAFALHDWLGWAEQMHALARPGGDSLLAGLLRLPGARRRVRSAAGRLPVTAADRAVTGESVDFFQDWLAHPEPGEFWDRSDHRDHAANMPPVVHLAGGWQDIFLPGTIDRYAALREAGKQVRLLVGPWTHGGGVMTRGYQREAFAVLDHALRGAGSPPSGSVRVFVPGADRWEDHPEWPPVGQETARWRLRPGGRLEPDGSAPGGAGPDDDAPGDSSRFRYDPADPTPAVGGPRMYGGGVRDNRSLEARPDVLTFTGPELPDDLDVHGTVAAEIHLRSSLSHTDVLARLCDVAPNGRSVNVCDGILRLTAQDEPDADGVRAVRIDLWPTAYRFRRGHRLRLQVSGGAHPRYDRNLGTGDQLGTEAVAVDQEILHDAARPSAVLLPVPADGRRGVPGTGPLP
ncbi:CocE/NonD family hydrolase [Promicromonospora aerolata]|uniref:CocE/NonD family hydrolase n=1 Tax=Promicromonospora aerolata TaxID=195749 RepID=A0ABW4V4Y0_9MICO